jgi:hypothetical protein
MASETNENRDLEHIGYSGSCPGGDHAHTRPRAIQSVRLQPQTSSRPCPARRCLLSTLETCPVMVEVGLMAVRKWKQPVA